MEYKYLRSIIWLILIAINMALPCIAQTDGNDSIKCWSVRDPLKWRDFRGKVPDESDRKYLSAASALRLIPVTSTRNGLNSIRIKVIFRRGQSWSIDTAKYLLNHEQLHFDIMELHARKLRKTIQDFSKISQNPTKEFLNEITKRLYLEIANMQAQYDRETIHGIDAKSQNEWMHRICLDLDRLKTYASTDEDCE